jgi:hypothetical protein
MKNTILKVVEQNDYDRYVFLTYDKDQIIGLNFHMGIGAIDYYFSTPCTKLTEIFDRYSKKNPDLNLDQRVNFSIDLYQEAFIFQNQKILLPSAQRDIIRTALSHYLNQYEYFVPYPDHSAAWGMHDIKTLIAFMNYNIQIELSDTDIENFTAKNGIDLPIYN